MHISFAKMLTACVGAIPDILRVQERASTIRKCYIRPAGAFSKSRQISRGRIPVCPADGTVRIHGVAWGNGWMSVA